MDFGDAFSVSPYCICLFLFNLPTLPLASSLCFDLHYYVSIYSLNLFLDYIVAIAVIVITLFILILSVKISSSLKIFG